MKKGLSKLLCLVVFALLVSCVSFGCGDDIKQYDSYEDSYMIITDDDGNSDMVIPLDTARFTYEYDEYKTHKYWYKIYMRDGSCVGEGRYPATVEGYEEGTSNFSLYVDILHPQTGKKIGRGCFYLSVTIKEKPDLRVTPEVYFDPNGATIEGEGDDIKYVYKYDGEIHYPIIGAKYENEDIESDLYYDGIRSIYLNGEFYNDNYPRDIGVYTVYYEISNSEYIN